MVVDTWTKFVKLLLDFAGHGYIEYSTVVIPVKKIAKAEVIDGKIFRKYSEIGSGKDQRYRNKKKGLANFKYIRWQNIGVILRTEGHVADRPDSDKFRCFDSQPLFFSVGSTVEIKIAKAKAGKKYTAYLAKGSYRAIKGVLRDNVRHRRITVAEQYWERLRGLPAFSGILEQVREMEKWIRMECKLTGQKKWPGRRLVLRPL